MNGETNLDFPTIADILEARKTIELVAHKTPVFTSTALSEYCGLPSTTFLVKAEPFQKGGAFKFRGAYNSISDLIKRNGAQVKQSGVTTHSSGNHGQALALAAKMLNVPAHIVMPSNSPQVKKDAVRGYGATVIECEPSLISREETVQKLIDQGIVILM
jgi:threonine dehydratase